MKIVVETTEDKKMFTVRVWEGDGGDLGRAERYRKMIEPQDIVDTLMHVGALLVARTSKLSENALEHFRVFRQAMDALDSAAEKFHAKLEESAEKNEEAWNATTPEERAIAQHIVEQDVEESPVLRVAMGQARTAYTLFHKFLSTPGAAAQAHAAALGQIAAGVAAGLYSLGDDHDTDRLREMYEQAEPLITVLLGMPAPAHHTDMPLNAKGGEA